MFQLFVRYLLFSSIIWIAVYCIFSLCMGIASRWKTYRGIDYTGLQINSKMNAVGEDGLHDYKCGCFETIYDKIFNKNQNQKIQDDGKDGTEEQNVEAGGDEKEAEEQQSLSPPQNITPKGSYQKASSQEKLEIDDEQTGIQNA